MGERNFIILIWKSRKRNLRRCRHLVSEVTTLAEKDDPMIQNEVIEKFSEQIRRWRRLTSTEQDGIISDSLDTYRRKITEGEQIQQPLNFLLSVARNHKRRAFSKRKESQVKERAYRALLAPDRHRGSVAFRSHSPVEEVVEATPVYLDLDSSPTWHGLPPLHKELFRLVIVEELPVATAARMIGESRSTAKSWLQRDKQKLSCDERLRQLAKIDQRNPMESLQCQ